LSGRLCLWAQLQFTHFVNKLLLLSSITTTAILPSQLLLLSLILSKFSSADYALQNTFTDLVKWRSPTNFPLRLADCDFVSRSPCNSIITISGTLPSFSNLQKKHHLIKLYCNCYSTYSCHDTLKSAQCCDQIAAGVSLYAIASKSPFISSNRSPRLLLEIGLVSETQLLFFDSNLLSDRMPPLNCWSQEVSQHQHSAHAKVNLCSCTSRTLDMLHWSSWAKQSVLCNSVWITCHQSEDQLVYHHTA